MAPSSGSPARFAKAGRSEGRIAPTGFGDDDLRSVEFVFVPVTVPPFPSGELISGEPHILARTRNEVAGDGGFDVKAWQHGRMVAFRLISPPPILLRRFHPERLWHRRA